MARCLMKKYEISAVILIMAYGNSLRTDDAAGLHLAQLVEQACQAQQLAVEKIITHQLLPELAPEIARADAVLFVDTRAVPPEEFEPAVQIQPIAADISLVSLGHHLSPAALLAYAGLLYGCRPPAWLLTAPGTDFAHGEGLSQLAQRALAAARPIVAKLLAQLGPIQPVQ